MALLRLDINDFRNLPSVKFEPHAQGFNLLYGLNGSGKTSILEAIYYLTRGRSFRTSLISKIIRRGADKFTLFAQVAASGKQILPLGIERALHGEAKIRIGGRDTASSAELAELIPARLINSQCYNLLDSGPLFRRKYLDWGIFYLNTQFLRVWKDFSLALKQRNAALRHHAPKKEIDSWTQEVLTKGLVFDQYRREYVEQLLPVLEATLAELLALTQLKISYQPGWDQALNYADVLASAYPKDAMMGHTQFGPHRADLRITINKVSAKDILSRGQQKLFVCAMILAQGTLLKTYANKCPIYLIDDLPAELDIVSRTRLIALLSKQETQVFVTAVEREALSPSLKMLPLKMFHVEHGCVIDETPRDETRDYLIVE